MHLLAELQRAQDDLYQLVADVGGMKSQSQYDQLEERAQAIARRIRSAFRRR